MKYKKTFIHKKFNNFILRNQVFLSNSSILVAVSGGQDSICLLKLLKDFQYNKKWNIHVVHFDHIWRADSKRNALFVAELANKWNFFFI
uniref:tRNA(Ile)-lysidine synthase n=1 Tax=Pseudoerythrocladia kornmannii TaxID=753682 RepID=UPI001FCE24B6|nr:tRNA(Ile)-lysidine synthase [Pseudoerythrocladia kornmannii]UNJ16696.1 tRNA(Ile)-lysidine synthase [Pseudoerythrocladia kornmannii]